MAEILIVDDDESDRLRIGAMLKPLGHRLHFATSGHEALRVYFERPIRAVVTDIAMPDGSGIELIASLKAIRPDVPVIAVSGKGPGGLSAAQALGAQMILTKPVVADELIKAIRAALP